jgi:hypothetical protein
MSNFIRASLVFEYFPEEDEIMQDLSPEEQEEYVLGTVIEDIFSYQLHGELQECIKIERIYE